MKTENIILIGGAGLGALYLIGKYKGVSSAVADVGANIAVGAVKLPFEFAWDFGQEIGRQIPVGTWIADTNNTLNDSIVSIMPVSPAPTPAEQAIVRTQIGQDWTTQTAYTIANTAQNWLSTPQNILNAGLTWFKSWF